MTATPSQIGALGQYLATTPTLTDGQQAPVQFDANGNTKMSIGAVALAPLVKGNAPLTTITCTTANQDFAAATNFPTGSKYMTLKSTYDFSVAMGEATTTSIGYPIDGGVTTMLSIVESTSTVDNVVHVQSATTGAVVNVVFQHG